MRYNGFEVRVNAFLPVDGTAPASCIETREPVRVMTGQKINCVRVEGINVIWVTQEIYDILKNQLKE